MQDSVIVACDYVLKKAEQNDKVFQYVLVTLLNKYANSKVMGDDAVYVHLVNNYYATDKAWWTDEETVNKMKERAGALEPILIGKISPDLNLRDTTVTNFVRLHSVESDYTIIFIWDPDCGHCKKAAPVLKKFYDKHKNDGIKVYAITTVSIEELDKWKKFIRENDLNFINVGDLYHQTKFRDLYDISSTPQIFILDSKKEIIAKRLGVEQLENFFHQYLKIKDDARYNNFEFKKVEPLEEGHNEHDGHGH
ncbi:MAG: TlpA disulfide reductase family protein [Chitinophagales bacterium]